MNPTYISAAAFLLSAAVFIYAISRNRNSDLKEYQKEQEEAREKFEEKQKEEREKFETRINNALKALEREMRDGLRAIEKMLHDLHTPLDTRVIKIETRLEPFWQKMTVVMGSLIHSPHTPRLDHLIERNAAGTISLEEMEELIESLRTMSEDQKTQEARRLMAALMLISLEAQDERSRFSRRLVEYGY